MIKVSIIVPVYNVSPYICDCLMSVMSQTYTGCMECLIIDDCGTDDSIAISERMIADYTGSIQFRILRHKQNRGLSAARNTGTLQATGNYVFYLDSDDTISHDCIEKLISPILRDDSIEMVQGNVKRHKSIRESLRQFGKKYVPIATTNEEVRKTYFHLKQMNVTVWNKLIRRDFLINNDIFCMEGVLFEDYLWTFIFLKYLHKVAFVSDITYYYRIRPNSISTGTDQRTKDINCSIINYEIMTHLTPGFERDELNFYARDINGLYVNRMYDVPEFKKVFLLCRDNCRQYGGWWLRLLLTFGQLLGNYRNRKNRIFITYGLLRTDKYILL